MPAQPSIFLISAIKAFIRSAYLRCSQSLLGAPWYSWVLKGTPRYFPKHSSTAVYSQVLKVCPDIHVYFHVLRGTPRYVQVLPNTPRYPKVRYSQVLYSPDTTRYCPGKAPIHPGSPGKVLTGVLKLGQGTPRYFKILRKVVPGTSRYGQVWSRYAK